MSWTPEKGWRTQTFWDIWYQCEAAPTWPDAHFDDVSAREDELLHHLSSHHVAGLQRQIASVSQGR